MAIYTHLTPSRVYPKILDPGRLHDQLFRTHGVHPLFNFLRHVCRGFLRFRASLPLQFVCDLLEARHGDLCLWTDVLLEELATTMPVCNPVDATAFPGFLPSSEMPAILR